MKLTILVLTCLVGHVTPGDIINNYCSGSPTGSPSKPDALVAFSVGSSTPFRPTDWEIIPMENIIYNKGNHFKMPNTTKNAFYAPVNGVYSFWFSGVADVDKIITLNLYRQKQPGETKVLLARARDQNYGGKGWGGGAGGSVIVELEQGESVSVWMMGAIFGSHGLYGEPDPWGPTTLFSGKLEQRV